MFKWPSHQHTLLQSYHIEVMALKTTNWTLPYQRCRHIGGEIDIPRRHFRNTIVWMGGNSREDMPQTSLRSESAQLSGSRWRVYIPRRCGPAALVIQNRLNPLDCLGGDAHRIELPAIFELEHDCSVLEYYDQVPSIKLEYRSAGGKRLGFTHTPGFFVIREDAAGWEKCNTEDELKRLAHRNPNR